MGRLGQAWQAARGPKVLLCAPLSSISSPWGAWGRAGVIGDGVPWHFTHGRGIFLTIPFIPSTSRSPASPMAALWASPQISGCWRRGLGFTLVISAWQCLVQCFPSALQSQYKHSSAFLQLAPWKQSSQTSNIFPFLSDKLTSQTDASLPRFVSQEFWKETVFARNSGKGLPGIKMETEFRLDRNWSSKFPFSLVLEKKDSNKYGDQ